METIRQYRAMGQLCRQQAVFHPENSWQWLSEARRWEDLAEREVAAYYLECNFHERVEVELTVAAA